MADQLQERLATITRDRRELLAILSGMVEGVVAVDPEERIVLMNRAAGHILRVDPDDATGRPLWEAVRLPQVPSSIRESVRTGGPHQVEVRVPEDGLDRVLQLHASPVRSAGGGESGAVVVLHDITELRQLESVRRDFVANASHELKTPVASIRGLVETILEDRAMEPETRQRFLSRVIKQSDRLSELIEEMLALSRLESAESSVQRQAVDMREPVREAVDAAAPLAREKSLSVDVEMEDAPLEVAGSPEALRRIAGNLLDNAIKYSPEEAAVQVRLGREDESVVLRVRDEGPGIPLDKHDRIFERFYRVDEGRSREAGGTGLGLAIVKHLVQALGGQINVESRPGHGSVFAVRLPGA